MLRNTIARRSAFTLLEVLLAAMIAALLLGGLYLAMNMTLQQTQTSRDAVEAEDLARGLTNKMAADFDGLLAPMPPKSGGNAAGSGSTSTAPAAPTTPTTPTTPAAPTAPTDPAAPAAPTDPVAMDPATDPTMPGATDGATANAAAKELQAGLVAFPDEKKIVLFLGKVPEGVGRYGYSGQPRGDLRQVIYQCVPDLGLCRQERVYLTADDVTWDLDQSAPGFTVLAEEVKDIFFEFPDGEGGWTDTWNGSDLGPDGVTPIGPPRAVRITLLLEIPLSRSEVLRKQITHVIPIRSAPGTYTPPLVDAPSDGGDSTTPTEEQPAPTTPTTPPATPSTPTVPQATPPAAPSAPTGGTGANPGGGTRPNFQLPSVGNLPPGVTIPGR